MRLLLSAGIGIAIGWFGSNWIFWFVQRRRRPKDLSPTWRNETAYDKRGDHL